MTVTELSKSSSKLNISEILVKNTSPITPLDVVEKYKFAIGIHVDNDRVHCSVAHTKNQFKIFTIRNWDNILESDDDEVKNQRSFLSLEEEFEKRYPTYVKYNTNDKERYLSGNQVINDDQPYDVEVDINDVIYNYLSGKEYPIIGREDLSTHKILSDFFSKLIEESNKIFQKHFEEEASFYVAALKRQNSTGLTKDQENTITDRFEFSPELCRYSITGPNHQDYQSLIRSAFLDAGIISEDDKESRLTYLSAVEALGYHYVSSDEFRVVKGDTRYVLCDINYNFVSFSEVQFNETESTSIVEGFGVPSSSLIEGWAPLERLYRQYWIDQNESEDLIEERVITFRQNYKEANLHLEENSGLKAITDFTECIFELMLDIYNVSNKSPAKILYFGDTTLISQFGQTIDTLVSENKMNGRIKMVEVKKYNFSEGSVSYAFKVENVQLPRNFKELSSESITIEPKYEDKPVSKDDYDYVIGMDFGTTYSGCSYASTETREVRSILDWPENKTDPKARTALLYNRTKKKFEDSWGEAAKRLINKDKSLLEGFKLLLAPQGIALYYGQGNKDVEKYERLNQLYHGDVKQIIAEYLRKLSNYTINYIKNKMSFIERRKKLRIKYVITIPCMWNQKAKSTMLEAAVLAGLAKKEEEITLITEPEAAAICCGQVLEALNPLDHRFIVCDAGGGTVDLVTFESSTEILDGESISTYKQLGDGCGNTLGSNILNKKFQDYILEAFSAQFNRKRMFFEDLLDQFDIQKRTFTKESSDLKLEIPTPLRKDIEVLKRACTKGKIVGNQYVIPFKDMEALFDSVTNNTIELLEAELQKSSSDNDNPVKSILLVGGFAMSGYLQKKVSDWCDTRDLQFAQIQNQVMTAVSHGAVSYGLKPRLATRRNAGQTYSLLVDDGIKKFSHFIKKGASIELVANKYKKAIEVQNAPSIVIAIYSTEEDIKEYDDAFDGGIKYEKVLETRIDNPCKDGKSTTIYVSIQFDVNDVHCYVKQKGQDIALVDTVEKSPIAYQLRYPSARDNIDAMGILNSGEYKPYASRSSR